MKKAVYFIFDRSGYCFRGGTGSQSRIGISFEIRMKY
jgi:hypothetical protein